MSNKPIGGLQNANVDMRNGKLNFSIPLVTLKTPGGLVYDLNLKYDSIMMPGMYESWNRENNVGLLGVGWSLNIEDNIFALREGSEISYYLLFKGLLFKLEKNGTTENMILFKTSPYSNFNIQYYTVDNYFTLFDEYGAKYIFGRDDVYTLESGTYDTQTGNYSEASNEYLSVRELLSNPDDYGIPNNVISDNTCNSSIEKAVCWGNWTGPSVAINTQTQQSMCWKLSHIIDAFNNVICFSYIQHLSNVCNNSTSKSYNICSYLYRISVFIQDIEIEKIIFNYDCRTPGEYNVDFTLYKRPNGIQYRFQKLFLDSIIYNKHGKDIKKYIFKTEMMDTWDSIGELCKRQLTSLEIQNLLSDVNYEPGYNFTYYCFNDGVSIGRAGFDDDNKLYNASNGAAFGQLKTVEYPNGKIEKYRYEEYKISSICPDMDEKVVNLKKQKEILTPYNYHLIFRLFNDNIATLTVYTWTIMGWIKQELFSATVSEEIFDSYNYESKLDFSDNNIVFASFDLDNIFMYKLSSVKAGQWDSKILASTISLTGKIFSVSISNDKMLLCTLSSNVFWIYPFILNDDSYHIVGTPININNKVGVTQYVSSVCLDEGWVVLTLYKDSRDLKPNGFAGNAVSFSRYVVRCFYITDDGTSSTVKDIGYVPNGMIYTDFTTPTPPIVTEPIMFSAAISIGGLIKDVLRVDKMGKVLVMNLLTEVQMAFYGRNSITQNVITKSGETSHWSVAILFNKDDASFKLLGESELRNIEYQSHKFNRDDLESITVPISSVASGNGITYTYRYEMPERDTGTPFIDAGCYEYIYDGESVTSIKDFSGKNYLCMFRDNFFEAFYTIISENSEKAPIYRRAYRYYDQYKKKYVEIETGSVDTSIITYNEQDANTLKYLGYANMGFSIFMMPLGLTSVLGLIITALSVGLMASTSIVLQLLNNSMRISYDPNVTFYGNRFLIDGNTVWFRNNGQEKLETLGKGLNFTIDDGVKGNVLTDMQQFGTVYNYIPFFTDSNCLYYTNLKNGTMKKPKMLNGWAEGITGIDYNPLSITDDTVDNNYYLYKGNTKYIFDNNKVFISAEKFILQNEEIVVDAVVRFLDESKGRNLLYFSGSYFYIYNESRNMFISRHKISEAIKGCEFSHVDAVLYEGWLTNDIAFYLFSGDQLVNVQVSEGQFNVIQMGAIRDWSVACPYDTIDSACYLGNNRFILTQNSNYAIIDTVTNKIEQQGKIGELFTEVMSPENINLQFNYDAMTLLRKKDTGHIFSIKKYLKGSLQAVLKDYVVSRITVHDSDEIVEDLYYTYDSFKATYMEEGQTVAYREICTAVEV